MIFRLSQKLGKKIHVTPDVSVPLADNPFCDWSGHLFTAERTQFILLTNTASLYSAMMYGRGITTDSQFIDRALDCIRERMVADGFEFIYRRLVAPDAGTVRFSKALNRSVTGSMNDFVHCARFSLVERASSPFNASAELNGMPMSALKYGFPIEAFTALDPGQSPSNDGSEQEGRSIKD